MESYHPIIAFYHHRLKPLAHFLQTLLNSKWLRIVISILVLFFVARFLTKNYQDLQNELISVELRWSNLLLGQFCVLLAAMLGPMAWWFLLRGFGQRITFMQSTRAFTLSQIMKYIPGFAWQYLSKGYLTREAGVSNRVIALALSLELIQTIGLGFAIALATAPAAVLAAYGASSLIHLIRITGVVFSALIFLAPHLLALSLKKITRNGMLPFSAGWLSVEQMVIAVGWLLLGFSLYAFTSAFSLEAPTDLSIYTSTMASGVVGGILVLLIPQGIGVREGIIGIMLTHYLPSTTTLLVALTSRMCMTLAELILVSFVEIWRWRDKQHSKSVREPTQL